MPVIDPPVPPAGGDERTEPLLARGVVTSLVSAVLALVAAFGVPLTAEQQAAILAVAAVAGPLVVAWWARGHVWSPDTVRRLVGLASRRGGP